MKSQYKTGLLLVSAICFTILALTLYKKFSAPITQKIIKNEREPISDSVVSDAKQLHDLEIVEMGRSNHEQPIMAYVYGNGNVAILILAGIHGDEPYSVYLAKALNLSLQKEAISSDVKIVIVPIVNPDGILSQTRTNANGVDINRNFPTASWKPQAQKDRYQPGKYPTSEPETRVVIKLIMMYHPKLIVSIHAPLNCVNWDGPAEDLAIAIAQISEYPLKRDIGYQTPGSLGQYAGIEHNIATITLELSGSENNEQMHNNIKALRAAFLRATSM